MLYFVVDENGKIISGIQYTLQNAEYTAMMHYSKKTGLQTMVFEGTKVKQFSFKERK